MPIDETGPKKRELSDVGLRELAVMAVELLRQVADEQRQQRELLEQLQRNQH